MDAPWLNNIDQNTAVIVPTRSLVTLLGDAVSERFARSRAVVWEPPNIFTWQDYLHLLWRANRQHLSQSAGVHTLLSQQQGLLLWTSVIEQSRQDESELALLNVQQTARAVQRSWRMLHDWQVSSDSVDLAHVADAQQFLKWTINYKALLSKRGFIDDQLLLERLLNAQILQPYTKLIWYAYDLVTNVQHELNHKLEAQGLQLEFKTLTQYQNRTPEYQCYATGDEELTASLVRAKQFIETQPDSTINVVIPDLQNRLAQVGELAREIFYPTTTPLQLQRTNLVYRFSLGEPLKQWPAIETALSIVNLLKGRVSITDLGFLFRNQFLRAITEWRAESRQFEQWLQRHRINSFGIDSLPGLYQQCLGDADAQYAPQQAATFSQFLIELVKHVENLQNELDTQKQANGYRTLPFSRWLEILTDWLKFWGWNTAVAQDNLDSVQFQLQQRWQSLLEEFVALEMVQRQVGLFRVCAILQQMARDSIFLPKATAAPILISGVFDAIGRSVDFCILTGMDDCYPVVANNDPFIANSLRKVIEYPAATSQAHFTQSQKVINSLLASGKETIISYAKLASSEDDVERGVSALFRYQEFVVQAPTIINGTSISPRMQDYQDTVGPAWQGPLAVPGGSTIFENQSNCALKAFATHQLGFVPDTEAEFGLDSLDRGNIVHRMLDLAWARLQTQSQLKALIDQQQFSQLVDAIVTQVLIDPELKLPADKKNLLQHEKLRLKRLLTEWLLLDAKRPTGFSVVEREERRYVEFAGIGFHYIIDRLDFLDDGRTVIIDYKTGIATKRDWQGERIRKPQLPLYTVALEQLKRRAASGIAYAKVKQHDCQYEELAEAGIFKTESKHTLSLEEKWLESHAAWPAQLAALAEDFLAGKADVNPIDEKSCVYCDLQSLCRVSQLRSQSIEELSL